MLSAREIQYRDIRLCLGRRSVGALSLQQQPGEVIGLIGPNGAGKTSLLKAIAGHMPIEAGAFNKGGVKQNNLAPFARRTATVFQDSGLFPHLSGLQNLEAGLEKGRQRAEAPDIDPVYRTVQGFVTVFDVSHFIEKRASTMSGGEQQLVAIGRAVLSLPELLLLDEPTASLDQLKKQRALQYLRKFCTTTRTPALVVSHDSEVLIRLCDRVVALNAAGNPVSDRPIDDLRLGAGSFTAAKIIGLSNLFEIDQTRKSFTFEGLKFSEPAEISAMAVALHVPALAWHVDAAPGNGDQNLILLQGWLESARRDEHGWLLVVRSYPQPSDAHVDRSISMRVATMPSGLTPGSAVYFHANISDVHWLKE